MLPADRWYLACPLSSQQGRELLAARGIDVSHRTMRLWGAGSRTTAGGRGPTPASRRQALVRG